MKNVSDASDKPKKQKRCFSTVDGITYSGYFSVHQKGKRVWIDGKEVGVECDNDGEPLATAVAVKLPPAVVHRPSFWDRMSVWLWGA
jgi:hypothetical protein